jgi:hypothetical protein
MPDGYDHDGRLALIDRALRHGELLLASVETVEELRAWAAALAIGLEQRRLEEAPSESQGGLIRQYLALELSCPDDDPPAAEPDADVPVHD